MHANLNPVKQLCLLNVPKDIVVVHNHKETYFFLPRFTRSRFTTKTLHNSSTNRYKQRTTKGDHKRSLLNTRDPTKNEIVWWGIGGAKMRERWYRVRCNPRQKEKYTTRGEHDNAEKKEKREQRMAKGRKNGRNKGMR